LKILIFFIRWFASEIITILLGGSETLVMVFEQDNVTPFLAFFIFLLYRRAGPVLYNTVWQWKWVCLDSPIRIYGWFQIF